ncbi:branched-chain amino acid ABC transporter permease [Variovorax sp. GB1P17]|uniref:branched-chain amino acid ABC transporter permease n=1 Tax=Variovorax sp. GB1P17 TaxID=3443740 RepID=UPI003F476952
MPVIELLVGGILLGGIYALIACGLNLIFGVMRVINFAHGELVAISALAAVSMVTTLKLPFWAAVVTLPFAMAMLGWLMQNMVLRKLEGMPPIMSLLATYAISTILVNAAILVWGGGYIGMPGVLSGSITLLGHNVSLSRLVSFVVALGVSLAIWWFLSATRFGRAVRTVSQAPELAEISGIDVKKVRLATFALGAGMAGLAGVLIAPTFAVDAQLGTRFLIKGFAVVIVGGMGSYPGALLAALLLGLVEVFGGYFSGAVIGSALLFLIMLGMLLFRPRGLFGAGVRV